MGDLAHLKEGDKIGIASCFGESEPDEMLSEISNRMITNDKRPSSLVWQQDSMEEVNEEIRMRDEYNKNAPDDKKKPPLVWGKADMLAKDVLKGEIDAANVEAKNLCKGLGGGQCCSSVQIYLKARDNAGKKWLNRPASKKMGFQEGPYGKPLACPADCANSGGNLKTRKEIRNERE